MGVVFEHLPGDMTRDGHNSCFTGLRFSQFGNCVMPKVVEAECADPSRLSQTSPCRSPTLLRSCRVETGILTRREGHHEFTYSLYPHAGTWRDAQTVRRGNELNYALLTMQTANHQGALAAEHSFLQVEGDDVVVTAVKRAEDGGALIVRFYEWGGKESTVRLLFPPGAESAAETDLMERPAGSISLQGGAVSVPTKPYEIKTVKISFAGSSGIDYSIK